MTEEGCVCVRALWDLLEIIWRQSLISPGIISPWESLQVRTRELRGWKSGGQRETKAAFSFTTQMCLWAPNLFTKPRLNDKQPNKVKILIGTEWNTCLSAVCWHIVPLFCNLLFGCCFPQQSVSWPPWPPKINSSSCPNLVNCGDTQRVWAWTSCIFPAASYVAVVPLIPRLAIFPWQKLDDVTNRNSSRSTLLRMFLSCFQLEKETFLKMFQVHCTYPEMHSFFSSPIMVDCFILSTQQAWNPKTANEIPGDGSPLASCKAREEPEDVAHEWTAKMTST